MKIKSLLGAAAAVLAISSVAQAQTTYIEITGATAFRSAAVASINAAFAAGGNYTNGFASTDSASGNVTQSSSTYQIWKGTFGSGANSIAGTTVIRASWNGSVEGIRAIAVPSADNNPLFLKESLLANATATSSGGTAVQVKHNLDTAGGDPANYELAQADMSFSDCLKASTPIGGSTLQGGPVGVVAFTMIASKSWADDKKVADAYANRLPTSISAQQFRTLARDGSAPISLFTGNLTDNGANGNVTATTTKVYLTGRNDGSGTRTAYLAETGFGVSKPVIQYVVHDRSTGTIEKIVKVPKGGGFNFQNVAKSDYASTIWSNDANGNGGYSTGGDIRSDLAKTSASAAVWEFTDGLNDGEPDNIIAADEDSQAIAPTKLYLLSWLSTSDARTARGTGMASARTAEILGYNGVILSGLAGDSPGSTLSAADKALIASGQYAAWSFQQLYYTGAAATSNPNNVVFNNLKAALNNASTIGSAGLALGEMRVNRAADGGTIVPNSIP